MVTSKASVLARAGARGLVASMAMSGLRRLTGNLGLMREAPPEAIVDEHAPRPVQELDSDRRAAVTELVHWGYGTGGGVAFGLLPRGLRRHPMSGPVYGAGIWLAFELGIAPALGVQHRQGRMIGRVMLMLDHVLYGVVVSGRLAPEPEVARRRGSGVRTATGRIARTTAARLLG